MKVCLLKCPAPELFIVVRAYISLHWCTSVWVIFQIIALRSHKTWNSQFRQNDKGMFYKHYGRSNTSLVGFKSPPYSIMTVVQPLQSKQKYKGQHWYERNLQLQWLTTTGQRHHYCHRTLSGSRQNLKCKKFCANGGSIANRDCTLALTPLTATRMVPS